VFSFAQGARHVKWHHASTPLSINEALLTLTAEVKPTWHLYSQNLKEGGPQPTRIRFDNGNEYYLAGNVQEIGQGNTYYDSVYEMEITWYCGVVRFIQKIKLNQPSFIKGTVEYMICDNQVCIPSLHEFNIHVSPQIKTH